MTLTQLEAFVLVARLGSVKAAAQVLGVSEPAVSGAVAALRQHLGDPLVVRTSGGMDLTPGGQRLLPIASQMVNLATEADGAIRRAQGAPEVLRVVATSTVAEYVARPLLTAFTARFGPVEAKPRGHDRGRDAGPADGAAGRRRARPALGGFHTAPVLRYRLVVVARARGTRWPGRPTWASVPWPRPTGWSAAAAPTPPPRSGR